MKYADLTPEAKSAACADIQGDERYHKLIRQRIDDCLEKYQGDFKRDVRLSHWRFISINWTVNSVQLKYRHVSPTDTCTDVLVEYDTRGNETVDISCKEKSAMFIQEMSHAVWCIVQVAIDLMAIADFDEKDCELFEFTEEGIAYPDFDNSLDEEQPQPV